MTRDFVGYGPTPPHANWPGGARIAVNFVINFEEGSELSYPAGDGISEGGLTESASVDPGMAGRRDLGAESMFEFGARVGWWRLYRIFTKYRVPVTLFACAKALEANPPAAEAIRANNWDICGHGYRWIKHFELDEAEERRQIAAAVALIRETTGKPTLGWYCRYAPSENTRRIVAEHGGFLYDSSSGHWSGAIPSAWRGAMKAPAPSWPAGSLAIEIPPLPCPGTGGGTMLSGHPVNPFRA